jgi:uncharacterized protein (DUF4415 family)
MATKKHKQYQAENIDYTDIPQADREWFENALISYSDWEMLKMNIDRDVLEWFRNNCNKYLNCINYILKAYCDGRAHLTIEQRCYTEQRELLVSKYEPAVVAWLKDDDDPGAKMSLVLRDFMQLCIERGEPKAEDLRK